MHGDGMCPIRVNARGETAWCIKNGGSGVYPCEWWDEHLQECALNVIVRLLRTKDD